MAQRVATVLERLVDRAAALTRPFNTQDAILIIKALSMLRPSSPHVGTVCERAAFALASASKSEVPVEVVIDAVHGLTSLQAGSMPVVHSVLVKRFAELGTTELSVSANGGTSRPITAQLRLQEQRQRTAQKAALTLMKLGRRHAPPDICEALLQQLHIGVAAAPHDTALRFAYIGLYSYSRACSRSLTVPETGRVRLSLETLFSCVEALMQKSDISALRGNAAWQALHLYPALSHVESRSTELAQINRVAAGKWLREWTATRQRFVGRVDVRHVSFARYAEFVHDFAEPMCSTPSLLLHLLQPLTDTLTLEGRTRFDVAKLATALAVVVTTVQDRSRSVEKTDATVQALLRSCALVLQRMTGALAMTDRGSTDAISLAACWHLASTLSHVGGEVAPSAETLQRLSDSTLQVLGKLITESSSGARPLPPVSLLTQYAWMAYSVARVRTEAEASEDTVLSVWRELIILLSAPGVLAQLPIRSVSQLVLSVPRVGTRVLLPAKFVENLVRTVSTPANLQSMSPADLRMLSAGGDGLLTILSQGNDYGRSAETTRGVVEHVLTMLEQLVLFVQANAGRFTSQARTVERCKTVLLECGRGATSLSKKGISAGAVGLPRQTSATPPAMTPIEAWNVLRQSGGQTSTTAEKACLCSKLWVDSFIRGETGDLRNYYGLVLKCADTCVKRGCRISFAAADGSATATARAFTIPVTELLVSPHFTPTDAAHVVRLMSDCLFRFGALCGVTEKTVDQLVFFAVTANGADLTAPGLLFLLHANKDFSASKKLFTKGHLVTLLRKAEPRFAELLKQAEASVGKPAAVEAANDPRQELLRLTRALLNSQVFLRFGPNWAVGQPILQAAVSFTCKHLSDPDTAASMDLLLKANLLFNV